MASFKTKSTFTNAAKTSKAKRDNLPGKLQNIATGIFVAGFAGAVTASRIMPPSIDASFGSEKTSTLLTQNHAQKRSAINAKAQAAMNESKLLMNDLIHTLHKARIGGAEIKHESMMRARNIARSLATLNKICKTNRLSDLNLLGEEYCASPAETALVHLSTGQVSLSSGIVIRIQGLGGTEQFSFASGTTQMNILNAINSFSKTLGIEAEQSAANPARVEVRSIEVGADSLVRMWGNAVVFSNANGGPPLADLKDYGKNAITLQAIQDDP